MIKEFTVDNWKAVLIILAWAFVAYTAVQFIRKNEDEFANKRLLETTLLLDLIQ